MTDTESCEFRWHRISRVTRDEEELTLGMEELELLEGGGEDRSRSEVGYEPTRRNRRIFLRRVRK